MLTSALPPTGPSVPPFKPLKVMRSASTLLVLSVAVAVRNVTAGSTFSGSYDPSHIVNIATFVPSSASAIQDNSSSSSLAFGSPSQEMTIDIALLANSTIPDTWLEPVTDYGIAADNRVLYQTTKWSLIEDGVQQGDFTSCWARFQALESTLSICAMVVDWEDSWKGKKAALYAVDAENRLNETCGENDTIALAFTSTVSETAVSFLKGEISVNDVAASIDMHNVRVSKAATAHDLMFVHLADGLCPQDESSSVKALSSQNETGSTVVTVFSSEPCWPHNGLGPSSQSAKEDSDDSDWKHDLRFIIPVGVFLFVIGCAGLVYLFRQKKKDSTTSKNTPTSETPREEKEDVSSLPYVLSMHQVA